MVCNICKYKSEFIFSAQILNKCSIQYFRCTHCYFVQTEKPYWLEEAYSESINRSDTGYLVRNLALQKILVPFLYHHFPKNSKFLDYAGGYGVFVRLMRDIGFDFFWTDKYTENLFSRGFQIGYHRAIDAITSFESFEHFENPIEELESMLSYTKNIIFSTELITEKPPTPDSWWYYGLDHGQHISFFSKKTLDFIADKHNLKLYSFNSIHFLTEKKITRLTKIAMKLSRFGLFLLYKKVMKSKTWVDYLEMSKNA
jgi:hypothetical protein